MILALNWKLYLSVNEQKSLSIKIANLRSSHRIIILPSLESLAALVQMPELRGLELGAQTFWHKKGSFTGEAYFGNLVELGVQTFLLNHVERKARGEDLNLCLEKFEASLRNRLNLIFCLEDNEIFSDHTLEAIKSLWAQTCPNLNVIFAYEPVSAVGGANPAAKEEVANARDRIKGFFASFNYYFLYGGSVNKDNVLELADIGVDGFLIGRASTNFETISQIVSSV